MRKLIYSLFLLLLLNSCSLFEDPDDNLDFGIKADHFLIQGNEQQTLKRNRNYLNVEFTPGQDLDALSRLLDKYNFEFLNPSIDPTDYNYKTIIKVRDKPAEEYYTQYGGSTANSFGNDSGVVFALPVYELADENKKFLTNQLLLSFDESLSQDHKSHLLDSLKTADYLTHIEQEWLGDLFLLQVNKNSPMSSLGLSNHYQSLSFIKISEPNFGYALQRH